MPIDDNVCLNGLARKLVPWSVCTTFGKPTVVKNLVKAWVIAGAVILLRVMAS